MKLFFGVLFLVTAFAFAEDPANVLIYCDIEEGYGEAVLTAAANVWTSTNVCPTQGPEMNTQFNDALATGPWDIVIVENWYNDIDGLDWAGLSSYYDNGGTLFLSTWEWTGGTSGQSALAGEMGVSGFNSITQVIPHYAWEATHPICAGISDWGWTDPGLVTLNTKFTVSSATPVSGWTTSAQAGEAGICVAADGKSVISGFTPAYAAESVAIWENILEFMASGGAALSRSTWGGIKASF